MERRNIDRSTITSDTQYSNQQQRNYNYQHYNDNHSISGRRIVSLVPTQLTKEWTKITTLSNLATLYAYSSSIRLINNHTYMIQLFNSDATVKYDNQIEIVMRQMLTDPVDGSEIYASSITDFLVYTPKGSDISVKLIVAAPKNISMMRIYMYDITSFITPPIIDWEGNILN